MEEYKDPEKVEFITNPDGTISVWNFLIVASLLGLTTSFSMLYFSSFSSRSKDHNKACSGLEKRFKSSMIKKKGKMEESLLWQEK